MTRKTLRSDMPLPDVSEFYTHSKTVRREAEIARAIYLHEMFGAAFRKVRSVFRRWTDLFGTAQRLNSDARL
jgi:hypothetical protein